MAQTADDDPASEARQYPLFQVVASPFQCFHFLKLPQDIRLMVYRELLISNSKVHRQVEWPGLPYHLNITMGQRAATLRSDFRKKPRKLCSRILEVCWQIYEEALDVLYGENLFYVWEVPHMDPAHPDLYHWNLIRHLAIRMEDFISPQFTNCWPKHAKTLNFVRPTSVFQPSGSRVERKALAKRITRRIKALRQNGLNKLYWDPNYDKKDERVKYITEAMNMELEDDPKP